MLSHRKISFFLCCELTLSPGRHVDRRNRSAIDCSQTIWIIATNAVDHIILNYCEAHKDIFDVNDPLRQSYLVDELSTRMKKQLKTEFGVSWLMLASPSISNISCLYLSS
jgi:hypothetical protein